MRKMSGQEMGRGGGTHGPCQRFILRDCIPGYQNKILNPRSTVLIMRIYTFKNPIISCLLFYFNSLMRSTGLILFSLLLLVVTSTPSHLFNPPTTNHLDDTTQLPELNHELVKMTTSELTLNLSGISFPAPAPHGDNLNLSSLKIPGVVKCEAGYILKSSSCRLVDIMLMQNYDAQNLIVGELSLEELKTKQQQFIKNNPTFVPLKCEGDKPHLGRQGCISCAEPHPYFNVQTLRCAKCPKGSTYLAQIRNCQKVATNYVSDLESDNFLVLPDKNLAQYKKQTQQQKKSDPTLETCPEDKPYSTGAECISCPEDKPLFFLPSQSCTQCKQGSTYNPSTNLCNSEPVEVIPEPVIQSERQKWTVVKGLANIFGWNRQASNDLIDRATDISGSNSPRTVTSVQNKTRTVNKLIRKEVDSEDEPEGTKTETVTKTEIKKVAVEPIEENSEKSQ